MEEPRVIDIEGERHTWLTDEAEAAVQSGLAEPRPARGSFLERLRAALFPARSVDQDRRAARLAELEAAIAQRPDEAIHYVLRGELFLKGRMYDQAAADFQQALALLHDQVETRDWGIITQILRDRVLEGIRRTQPFSRPADLAHRAHAASTEHDKDETTSGE